MKNYQETLIDLLLDYKAFRTGEFKLKSGAISPYFVNFGLISDAKGMAGLGESFADCLKQELGLDQFDCIIGPAYKGISIAVATGMALWQRHGVNKPISYNRKEMKTHGADAGSIWVGGEIAEGARLVIVDDVFTTGGTKREIVDQLRALPVKVKPVALLVGVDRQQPASQGGENYEAFCAELGMAPLAVLKVDAVIDSMLKRGKLAAAESAKIKNYIRTGAL